LLLTESLDPPVAGVVDLDTATLIDREPVRVSEIRIAGVVLRAGAAWLPSWEGHQGLLCSMGFIGSIGSIGFMGFMGVTSIS
jgi:hypothetical protein